MQLDIQQDLLAMQLMHGLIETLKGILAINNRVLHVLLKIELVINRLYGKCGEKKLGRTLNRYKYVIFWMNVFIINLATFRSRGSDWMEWTEMKWETFSMFFFSGRKSSIMTNQIDEKKEEIIHKEKNTNWDFHSFHSSFEQYNE